VRDKSWRLDMPFFLIDELQEGRLRVHVTQ
jgi:hypothetical protein